MKRIKFVCDLFCLLRRYALFALGLKNLRLLLEKRDPLLHGLRYLAYAVFPPADIHRTRRTDDDVIGAFEKIF